MRTNLASNEYRPGQEGFSALWQGSKDGDAARALLHSVLRADWCLVSVVAIFLTVVFTNCEHFQLNNGLGHDGLLYAQLARDLPHKVFIEKLDSYRVQRLAIPAMLYCSSQVFGFELTHKTVLRLWRGLDLVCLTLLAYLWCLMVRELQISQRGKWLGALFLFVNFGVLKWSSFYPNLTDIPAYTLGAWMLYLHLKGQNLLLGIVTIVAAFNWPTAIYVGLLLLVFPRESESDLGSAIIPWRFHAVAAMLAGIAVYLIFHGFRQRFEAHYPGDFTQAPESFLNLGILLTAIYISGGVYYLLADRRLLSIAYYAARLKTTSFWIAVAVGAATFGSQRILGPNPPAIPTRILLSRMVWSSVTPPAAFLVAHVVFYGPIILLAILLWKTICKQVHGYGMGITLSLCLMLPLSLGSESRWLFNMIPLITPFVAKAIDEMHWQGKHYLFLAVISFLGSKVWLSMNPDWIENLLRLNVGRWMTLASYGVHGGIAVAIGYVLFTFLQVKGQGPRDSGQAALGLPNS